MRYGSASRLPTVMKRISQRAPWLSRALRPRTSARFATLRGFQSVGIIAIVAVSAQFASCGKRKPDDCPKWSCTNPTVANGTGKPYLVTLHLERVVTAARVKQAGTATLNHGEVVEGRFRATAVTDEGGPVRGARVRRGTYRARSDYTFDARADQTTASSLVVLTFNDPRDGRGCLEVSVTQKGSAIPTGTYTLLGGTKTAARLDAHGPIRYAGSMRSDLKVTTRLRTHKRGPHGFTPRCSKLADT